MKVIYGIGKAERRIRNAVLAIGVFDGLHIGHQKLIKAAVKRARHLNGKAVVMTFAPHPVQVLHPDNYLPFVVSLPHRLQLIEQLGVDQCVVIRFTKQFSQLAPEQFLKKCLMEKIQPKEVFVGNDFRFGRGRQGTMAYFKSFGKMHGFKVSSILPLRSGGRKIGSSRIRDLITRGRIDIARRLLGRPVSVMGRVVSGDGRGKTLGYPTANIHPADKVVLPVGVFAVLVRINGKRFRGMANIGHRPSFPKTKNSISIEVHIFDYKRNLYRKKIVIDFVQKIRREKKFNSLPYMRAQLKRDEMKARSILTNYR